jgi:hypothetical protein
LELLSDAPVLLANSKTQMKRLLLLLGLSVLLAMARPEPPLPQSTPVGIAHEIPRGTPAAVVSDQPKSKPAKQPRSEDLGALKESSDSGSSWVYVVRAAWVHSGPSVSAPLLRIYPLGMELHLIGYERGWFQVVDPATSQQGWIYEKYINFTAGPGPRGGH